MSKVIEFTRVNNDVNGNSRYVCSWLNFNTETYEEALEIAKEIGGKKFHNKQYGGGIVFGSVYNVQFLNKKINESVVY